MLLGISPEHLFIYKSFSLSLFLSLSFALSLSQQTWQDALGQDALLLSSPAERARARMLALAYAELVRDLDVFGHTRSVNCCISP